MTHDPASTPLREALEPFKRAHDVFSSDTLGRLTPDGQTLFVIDGSWDGAVVTYGDLRRLIAALASPPAVPSLDQVEVEMPAVVEWVIELARRDIQRTSTDFIGRMNQAMGEFENICDEHPDGEWPEDVRDNGGQALAGLAGLALAQLAMVSNMADPLSALRSSPLSSAQSDAGLREAAQRLIDKLAVIHRHPSYMDVWSIAQSHVGPYTGPNYEAEMLALQHALSTPAAPLASDERDDEIRAEIIEEAARKADDFATLADATFLAWKERVEAGTDGLEVSGGCAIGMAHQARRIAQAIRAALGPDAKTGEGQ